MKDMSPGLAPLPHPSDLFADGTFDAVLFDMDGTLINSIPITEKCWGIWMREHGYPPEHYHQFHGTPALAIVKQLVPEPQWQQAFQRIVDLEMAETDGIIVLPGVAEALASIPSSARAIVTSSTRGLAQLRLRVSGLEMPTLVCADDVEHGKPSPDPYLRGAELLGVNPERCVVFEDAPTGLLAGRLAGARTVAVPGTHDLASLDADAYLNSFEEIQFVWDDATQKLSITTAHTPGKD